MRDQDNSPALVGQFTQQEHHLTIQPGIQARRRLVQEENARIGQQFQRYRDALPLTARELADQQITPRLHLYIVEHLFDTLLDLLLGKVIRQAHLRRIIEGMFDGDVTVDDILLWYIAKLCTEGCQVLIVVLPVVEDDPILGRSQSIERIQQRGFTGTRTTHQGDELTWWDSNRDIVNQYELLVPRLFQMQCIDANAIAFIVLCQLRTSIGEFERT